MELGNGWNLGEPILRKLRMLEYLADYRDTSSIPPLPAWAQPGTELHVGAVGDLEDFEARGWVHFEQDTDGEASIQLHGLGRAVVDDVRMRRDNNKIRYRAARDALLHWLYDQYLTGDKAPNIDDFTRSPFGRFYGQPFTDTEVNEASIWLRDKNYLRGRGALGAGVIRPCITTEGIEMAESDRSVNDAAPIPAASVITITGSRNTVQNASPAATQHVTTTITEDHRHQAVALADLIEQSLPGLGDNAPDDARIVPDQIRAAARSKDDNALRRAVDAANIAMAGTIGTALGGVVVQNIHALMQAIGHA